MILRALEAMFGSLADDLEEARARREGLQHDLLHKAIQIGESLVSTYVSTYGGTKPAPQNASVPPSTPFPDYVPDEPSRTVLEDGRIAYDAMSREVVLPGGVAHFEFGVKIPIEGTGFPGLPDTEQYRFGVAENFKPEAIHISPGFGLTGGHVGQINAIVLADGSHVPAEALEPGKPQPDYPKANEGIVITIYVKNLTDKPIPCRGRIVGKALP